MKLYLTEKQYALVNKALPVMVRFYENAPEPLFRMIADDYGRDMSCAKQAAELIAQIGITAPARVKAKRLDDIATNWEKYTTTVSEGMYQYVVELSDKQRGDLSKALDVFSRITMGQLHILFEALDTPIGFEDDPHATQTYHDAYWDGKCGAKEARDLLFPNIRHFGWHGGYGISNPEVSEASRLAYQISRVLGRGYALPVVSQEPLPELR